MRLRLALPALCLTFCLNAASPWNEFMERRHHLDPRVGKWTLCVRQGDFPRLEAYADSAFQKLLTSGDCSLETLAGPVVQDLWEQKGWGREPHWVLLSPLGAEVASGAGRPRGAAILEAIHGTGAKPRFEARAAFLREHPDQGEARLEELGQAFQALRVRLLALDRAGKVRVPAWHATPGEPLARPRISLGPGGEGEAQADELYAEVAEAMARLLELPGWERHCGALASFLGEFSVGQAPRLRRLCAQAARGLEQALSGDPYDQDLANFWMEAVDAAGLSMGNLSGLCTPTPGQPWPDPGMLGRLLEPSFRRRDWDGALKLVADLTPLGPPEPMSPAGWGEHCRLQCALQTQRAIALAGQGSWDQAGAALGEARHWGGSHGVRESLLGRGSLLSGPGGDPSAWRMLLTQALGRDGDGVGGLRPPTPWGLKGEPRERSEQAVPPFMTEPPPMPEAMPPLRLVVGGMPKWLVAWTSLRGAAELAPWSPAELHWEVADRDTFEEARARFGWAPGPRWALYRGAELRVSGTQCPDPRALAAALAGEGPAMLTRLQGLLAAQPEHLAARRERMELLLRRMPDPRLEPLLVEDALGTLAALEFAPKASWHPDPALWGAAAGQALPALEQAIRTWPNRAYLWKAWISWARFHPARPPVLALAQSVPFWSPRGEWRSWLPYEVQRAVAAELKWQGNYGVMREWFRAVWDSLDHRPLRSLYRGERTWVMERRREEQTAVFQPLRDALGALGSTEEQAELERTFGEMMGRDFSRRR